MNAGTDPSSSVVEIESKNHIRITFTSDNKKWQAQWDFYPDRCDFTMSKVSAGYKYWVQYDNYVSRPDMTILGFGRENKKETSKYLNTIQTFSIGFVESTAYSVIDQVVKDILD